MTLLDRIAGPARAGLDTAGEAHFRRIAIIDIGSNSVRLVVYDGPGRAPFVLFNEKVMAGLGAEMGRTGRLGEEAMARSLHALTRFRRLCADMAVDTICCVATAAVRDALNGDRFVAAVEALDLPVRVLSGAEEGRTSTHGLLSGMPGADGVMGDLGGGSLELVRVGNGRIEQAISMPLGVLRVKEIRAADKDALGETVDRMLHAAGWRTVPRDLPFYLVGGSWRALSRVDMHATDYPLPIFHHYEMAPSRIPALIRLLGSIDRATLKALPSLSGSRIPTLPDAAALLDELTRRLGSGRLIVSAYGLREGLLFQDLPPDVAAQDPLLVAARAEGDAQGRFTGHGDLIERWIAPLFPGDPPSLRRIRHAACLLADVGWRANPDFRAERGLDTALHGNWVGIDAAERAMLAQALYTTLGGSENIAALRRLAGAGALTRPRCWGLAIRLAQRLSGGVADALKSTRIGLGPDAVELRVPPHTRPLLGEAAERRLKNLAQAIGLPYRITD